MPDANDAFTETRNLIPWKELTPQPWRNGGGVTRQILSMRRSRPGGWTPATDNWDWRLSIADVEHPGAFSNFPEMTRILTVIEGVSITLTVDTLVEELEKHRPFEFDGGAETSASLPHGPIRDLNLIARTDAVDAEVRIESLTLTSPRLISGEQYCVVLEGHVLLTRSAVDPSEIVLDCFDTIMGDPQHPQKIAGEGILAVITITDSTNGIARLSATERTGLR